MSTAKHETIALKEAYELVNEAWPFNGSSYPGLDELSQAKRDYFSISHCLRHISINVATIAEADSLAKGVSGPVAGGSFFSLIANLLRVSSLVGMNAEEIENTDPGTIPVSSSLSFCEFIRDAQAALEPAEHAQGILPDLTPEMVLSIKAALKKAWENLFAISPYHLQGGFKMEHLWCEISKHLK